MTPYRLPLVLLCVAAAIFLLAMCAEDRVKIRIDGEQVNERYR